MGDLIPGGYIRGANIRGPTYQGLYISGGLFPGSYKRYRNVSKSADIVYSITYSASWVGNLTFFTIAYLTN